MGGGEGGGGSFKKSRESFFRNKLTKKERKCNGLNSYSNHLVLREEKMLGLENERLFPEGS